MIEYITALVFHFFSSLGLVGAFLSMFIENIGIPLPTEIGYLIGQDNVNRGQHSFIFVLILLTIGHIIGSLISYSLGRWGDKAVTKRLQSGHKIKQIHLKLRAWYTKYGDVTIFATRFIGYIRPWSSFVAGFAGVEIWPFIIWTALGSLIFNALNLYLSSIFLFIWRRYAHLHFWLLVIGFVCFFALIIYEVIKFLISKSKE